MDSGELLHTRKWTRECNGGTNTAVKWVPGDSLHEIGRKFDIRMLINPALLLELFSRFSSNIASCIHWLRSVISNAPGSSQMLGNIHPQTTFRCPRRLRAPFTNPQEPFSTMSRLRWWSGRWTPFYLSYFHFTSIGGAGPTYIGSQPFHALFFSKPIYHNFFKQTDFIVSFLV